MIKFLRKTRRKLADDNKLFKYSRYAIGEIVLVVVGILIALSINNWNERENNITQAEKHLETIKLNQAEKEKQEQKMKGIEQTNFLKRR